MFVLALVVSLPLRRVPCECGFLDFLVRPSNAPPQNRGLLFGVGGDRSFAAVEIFSERNLAGVVHLLVDLLCLLCVGTMDREFILQLFLILCEPRLCRRIRRLLVRRYLRRVLLIIRPEVLRILSCTPLRFLVRWEEVLALLVDVDGGLIPDRLNFRGGLFVDPFFVGRGLRLERGSRCEVEVREASNFRIGQFPARSDVVPHLLEVHLNFRDDSADGIAEEEKHIRNILDRGPGDLPYLLRPVAAFHRRADESLSYVGDRREQPGLELRRHSSADVLQFLHLGLGQRKESVVVLSSNNPSLPTDAVILSKPSPAMAFATGMNSAPPFEKINCAAVVF